MTGKDVETVAVLLKRVRERTEDILDTARELLDRDANVADIAQLATDAARGMQSLAAAIEMVTIELAEIRAEVDGARFAERKHGPR